MCGRFYLDASEKYLFDQFSLSQVVRYQLPNYNTSPGQSINVIFGLKNFARVLTTMHWGFIPSWSREKNNSFRMSNARSETVEEKTAYKNAFKTRRCLIPINGYFEWKSLSNKQKQPHYFYLSDTPIFVLAGLWENWISPNGEKISSCTILTKSSNEQIKEIHHRMPVIIQQSDFDCWLNQSSTISNIKQLVQKDSGLKIRSHVVDHAMNKTEHNNKDIKGIRNK